MHDKNKILPAALRGDLHASDAPTRWWVLLLVVLAWPATSFGQLKLTTRADVQYQENTNVFDLASGAPSPTGNGDTQRSDSFVAYGVGLNTTYNWSRQTFSLDLDAHQYHYNHFTELNHDDYRLTADWEWKLGRILDGSLSVNRGREMVAFSSFIGTQLSLETNQNEHASMNIQVTPDWRVETMGNSSRSDSPRPGLPNLSLTEDTLQAGLRYVGHAGFTSGFSERYTTGTYNGADDATQPGYHEVSGQFLATYIEPRANMDMAAGYTSRKSANNVDNIGGFTGHFSYQYSLTVKTSAKLEVSRNVNSYITNAGSEIDTVARLHLSWLATHKLTVEINYSYTYSDLPGQGPNGDERLDHFRTAELNVDYRMTRWFELHPYARFEKRSSDLFGAAYSGNVYGVYGYLKWQALGPP